MQLGRHFREKDHCFEYLLLPEIRAINRTIESEISNITDVIYVNRGVGSRPARPPRPGRIQTSLTRLYKPVRFFKERKSITSYINLPIYITNLNNILFHKIDVVYCNLLRHLNTVIEI
jgi:hypothetical protein